MTMPNEFYRTGNYKVDHATFGGLIYQSDFNTDYSGNTNANDAFTLFWNQIDIDLITSSGFIGNIEYTTDGIEPSLVYEDDKFEFYYVFTNSGNTCTSHKYMANTGFCDFDKDNDELLENILLEELENILSK